MRNVEPWSSRDAALTLLMRASCLHAIAAGLHLVMLWRCVGDAAPPLFEVSPFGSA